MIDWHSHILPGIDDGSPNTAVSLAMLKSMAEQGVDTVIATPHFYANRETSVESFLERRRASEARLRERMTADEGLPRVICGAEVRYYPGISHMAELEQLTIGESGILLLEMPFGIWTEYTMLELIQMLTDERFTVLLAHIDRYWKYQSSRTQKQILDNNIHLQINAESLLQFSTRRKMLRLLEDKHARFIGSDAHNMTERPPEIGKAYATVRRKLGDGFTDRLDEFGRQMLTAT